MHCVHCAAKGRAPAAGCASSPIIGSQRGRAMQVDCGRPASPGASTGPPCRVCCKGASDTVGESHKSLVSPVQKAVTRTIKHSSAPAECPAGMNHQIRAAATRAHKDFTARAGCAKTPEDKKCWARHSHCCSDGGARGYSVVPKQLCWRECHASRDSRVKRPALHSVDGDFIS